MLTLRHHLVQESRQLTCNTRHNPSRTYYFLDLVYLYSTNVFWLFQQPRFKMTVMKKPLIIALLVEAA